MVVGTGAAAPRQQAPRLTCKLRHRGRLQLELKLHYPLRMASRQVFQTDVYVIAPDKLDLTSESYGVGRVLEEVVLLLRHSSPRIPLRDILRRDVAVSPLSRLAAAAEAEVAADRQDSVIHELKTLVNAYRAESRPLVDGARRAAARESRVAALGDSKVATQGGTSAAAAAADDAVGLLVSLPAAAREVRQRFEERALPPAIAEALEWADEGLSAIVTGELFRLLDALRGRRALRPQATRIRDELDREADYRARRGMLLALGAGRAAADLVRNEGVLLRIRALKRWSQSALYLAKRIRRENARVGQVAAGTAAALAMTFAVVAAAFAQEHFSMYSLPWAFIIIFSYILKDRIKEAVRVVIGALIPRLLSDRSHALVDNTGRVAGLVRETVRFHRTDRAPQEVRELRQRAPAALPHYPGDPEKSESVMHYRNWMRTRSSVLLRNHQRLDRLTALVRWGVDGWLEEMDEAFTSLRSIEDGREVRVRARRVYHVHLVVRVCEEGVSEPPHLSLYRVALSREGIVRTERLAAEASGA